MNKLWVSLLISGEAKAVFKGFKVQVQNPSRNVGKDVTRCILRTVSASKCVCSAPDPLETERYLSSSGATPGRARSNDLTGELPPSLAPWLPPWLTKMSINFINMSKNQFRRDSYSGTGTINNYLQRNMYSNSSMTRRSRLVCLVCL